ncbi:MAG: hypothetical protein GWN93_05795 [Deltaproteobacteria bacterium]|nr:hypothetical protein [Deltaproteobacteria bacterium]
MASGAYGRVPANSSMAWWNLTPRQKRLLHERRLAGEYGGETAAGVGRAPYFWAQEYGSAAANIQAQGFAARAWGTFRSRAIDVLRSVAA